MIIFHYTETQAPFIWVVTIHAHWFFSTSINDVYILFVLFSLEVVNIHHSFHSDGQCAIINILEQHYHD